MTMIGTLLECPKSFPVPYGRSTAKASIPDGDAISSASDVDKTGIIRVQDVRS